MIKYIDKSTGRAPDFEADRRMCLCLEPDEWEYGEEVILNKKQLRNKVNPMLGYIVQNSSYDGWISEARGDHTKMSELISKYFNHYVTGQAKSWVVTSDKVRQLQKPISITDCRGDEGWRVFVGMDFSSGEDLFAISYFAVNYAEGLEMKDRFFAACDAWILEAELNRSPNKPMYDKWIQDGWLHVCSGEAFDSTEAIMHIARLAFSNDVEGDPDYRFPRLNLIAFGFDPAQSKQPINTLKAWLQSIGIDADTIRNMVIPVSQSFMTMNPVIGELEHYILTQWLTFSESPLWPWMAGNVCIVTSRDDTLRRLHKSGANNKIDNFHALLDAIYVYELSEGKITT